MIINSRNRPTNTTRADLTSTVLALTACLVFFLGLAALIKSLPTALAGSAGLAAAWVMTLKMLAVPRDYH
ncbi:hypothetical protein [Nocardia sp. NPDC020380]|uniref:hypothetical protein n=1 Tax=Nocardia sp. NPDC020380 TaxID=3364309 RepID=UPI0037959516